METDQAVVDCEKLVYSIIRRSCPYYDKDDLYQAGMLGLSKALHNYNQAYDNQFSTYAYTYIWGEVLSFVREDKNIKISKDMIRLSRRIDKGREVLAQKLMRTPTVTELSLFLEIPEESILMSDQTKNFVLSLDATLNEDNDGKEITLLDTVSFEEKKYDADIQDLYTELAKLPEEERKLIEYRYFDDKTQSEISHDLGMSQVQVSRSENKILTKLQHRLVA